MAKNSSNQFSSKTLHQALDIPHQYLRVIMTELSKKGFISGEKGRNGGFVLIKNPDTIFIADIIDAIEGLDKIQKCIVGDTDCQFPNHCSLHDFWQDTRNEIIQKLKTTNLINFYL